MSIKVFNLDVYKSKNTRGICVDLKCELVFQKRPKAEVKYLQQSK